MRHFPPPIRRPERPASLYEGIAIVAGILICCILLSLAALAAAIWLAPHAKAAERWSMAPDGHWEMIDPEHGQWKRPPTGKGWRWVEPGDDWRRDPKGRWQVVPSP